MFADSGPLDPAKQFLSDSLELPLSFVLALSAYAYQRSVSLVLAWKLTTLVAGLRTAGISVPYVFEGAINGRRFRAYVEQMLAPTLAPGDIVLLDNLRSHKVAGIAEAIDARGAQLIYLPPYSPDLNPIEQAFAKYKALLRKAAERTVETLWQAIGPIADLFSPPEFRTFFNNAGYAT